MSSRESILQHALELFAKAGYRGASMRELALACGITKPALYHYFPTKEAIFEALLESGLSDLEQHLQQFYAPIQQSSEIDRLTFLIESLLTLPKRSKEVMRLSRQDLIHLDLASQVRFREAYRKRFTSPIEQFLLENNLTSHWPISDSTRLFLSMILPFAQEETGNTQQRAELLAQFFRNGMNKNSSGQG